MRLPVFANTRPREWIRFLIAAAVVLSLPLVLHDPFFVLVLQSLAYLFIVSLGLDILVGWTGQISLGHAGLYAIGAYTSALLATRAGWPFWISAPIGVVFAGVAGALALGRLLTTLLFEVSPADPFTIGAVIVALASVAAFACTVPALRAARVDPMTALRCE